MKYYIEAFRSDGSQILGNLDGQGVINGRWQNSFRYRLVRDTPKEKLSLDGRAVQYRIVNGDNVVVATINK